MDQLLRWTHSLSLQLTLARARARARKYNGKSICWFFLILTEMLQKNLNRNMDILISNLLLEWILQLETALGQCDRQRDREVVAFGEVNCVKQSWIQINSVSRKAYYYKTLMNSKNWTWHLFFFVFPERENPWLKTRNSKDPGYQRGIIHAHAWTRIKRAVIQHKALTQALEMLGAKIMLSTAI